MLKILTIFTLNMLNQDFTLIHLFIYLLLYIHAVYNTYVHVFFFFFKQMATIEITACRRSSGHGNITSMIDGQNKKLKMGKMTKRTIPIPVLPPRIPTPMPKLPNERYTVNNTIRDYMI